jgi:ABC-type nickel/cobalt efflux system permease component RcnA
MAEPGDILDSDSESSAKKAPWGWIISIVLVVGLAILTFWLTREKKNQEARDAVLNVLDKELTAQEDVLKAQREKVMELTRQVETLRSMIQSGQTPNGKAAVAQFKQLVAQQHAERDKFTQMAAEYNKKVASYKALKE